MRGDYDDVPEHNVVNIMPLVQVMVAGCSRERKFPLDRMALVLLDKVVRLAWAEAAALPVKPPMGGDEGAMGGSGGSAGNDTMGGNDAAWAVTILPWAWRNYDGMGGAAGDATLLAPELVGLIDRICRSPMCCRRRLQCRWFLPGSLRIDVWGQVYRRSTERQV